MQNTFITTIRVKCHFLVSDSNSVLAGSRKKSPTFSVPAPKFYVQVNPIQIVFDRDTCLWLNCFLLNLCHSLMNTESKDTASSFTYIDIKVEAILPRVRTLSFLLAWRKSQNFQLNFESTTEYHNQRDRPKCLSMQVTRATITNVRSLEHSSRADLGKVCSKTRIKLSFENFYSEMH